MRFSSDRPSSPNVPKIANHKTTAATTNMWSNSESLDDKVSVLRDLSLLAMKQENATRIGTDSFLEILFREMRNDTTLHSWGCVMLGNLALNDDMAARIGDKGGIQVILSGFLQHSTALSLDHKASVIAALANLAANDDNATRIGTEATMDVILRELRDNSTLLSFGNDLIGNLARHSHISAMIGNKGGIEVILSGCIRRNKDTSPEDKASAIRALANLARHSDNANKMWSKQLIEIVLRETPSDSVALLNADVAAIIGSKGGIEAMTAYFRNTTVSDDKLKILRALAFLAMEEENVNRIGTVKFIEVVIHQMRTDSALYSWGCVMLGNLALNDDMAALIGAKGGIEVVVSGIQNAAFHCDKSSVIAALANMAANDDNAKRMGTDALIEAVLHEMRKRSDLRTFGYDLLGNLARNNDVAALIGSKGGIEVIASNLRKAKFSEDKSSAIRALANLAGNEANATRLGTATFIDSVVREIRNDPGLHSDGCQLLENLALNDDIADIIGAKGGIEVIMSCLRVSTTTDDKLRVIRPLAFLAIKDETAQRIGTEEFIEVVLAEMQNDPALHSWGCVMLGVLALNDGISAMIGAKGGVEVILSCFRDAVSSADKSRVVTALANLAVNEENAKLIGTETLIEAVLLEMENDDLYADGRELLGVLACDHDIAAMIGSKGGIQAIPLDIRETLMMNRMSSRRLVT